MDDRGVPRRAGGPRGPAYAEPSDRGGAPGGRRVRLILIPGGKDSFAVDYQPGDVALPLPGVRAVVEYGGDNPLAAYPYPWEAFPPEFQTEELVWRAKMMIDDETVAVCDAGFTGSPAGALVDD